ncbi:ERV/ALR sulfhydryl oxidase domain-containing protein [Trametes elegans]|nr:ERV/ALR sulfhydryl oxidase domain-containing protein [Trametes elegans]
MMAAFASGTGFASTSHKQQQQQQQQHASASAPEQEYVRPPNCPPDVEELGRATWTFLHTTAAYYPDAPSMAHRVNMLSLLRSLPVLYPCSVCASHLGECMKAAPPDVRSRAALSRWLCERHNEVNERLGKEKFECTVEKLDERWKDGPADGSCD